MDVSGTVEAILHQKTGPVWSITPDATVYDAVAMMAEKNVGALLVVQDNRLVGILSERDYCACHSRPQLCRMCVPSSANLISPFPGEADRRIKRIAAEPPTFPQAMRWRKSCAPETG